MFKKATDYLTRIFVEQSEGTDFTLFFSKANNTCVSGNFSDGKRSYTLIARHNEIGLRVNKNSYIFAFQRSPITETEEFGFIFEDDEELAESFKDVEYVECFESDKEAGEMTRISYLVNKSEYLLVDYKQVSNIYCLSLQLRDEFIDERYFREIRLDRPGNPDFDISKSKIPCFYTPPNFHYLYGIEELRKPVTDVIARRKIINTICVDRMLGTDRLWYGFLNDTNDCVFSTKESLVHRFGKDILDER